MFKLANKISRGELNTRLIYVISNLRIVLTEEIDSNRKCDLLSGVMSYINGIKLLPKFDLMDFVSFFKLEDDLEMIYKDVQDAAFCEAENGPVLNAYVRALKILQK